MKSLAWSVTVILATVTMVLLVWQFRTALWLFLFSLAIAATFRSPIYRLKEIGIPLGAALIFTYTVAIVLFTLLVVFVGQFLLIELQELANDLAIRYEYIMVMWPQGNALQQAIAAWLAARDVISLMTGESEGGVIQVLLGTTSTILEIAGQVILVLLLSVYWAADRIRFEQLWLSLIPIESRAMARNLWRTIETNIGSYIRSELAQGLIAGLLLGSGFWLIGLKYPILLALIGAVAWFIPVIGGLLALIPVAIAVIINNPGLGILAVGYTLATFLVLEMIIEPYLFNRHRFNGLLMLLVTMACIDLFGLAGLVLGPPLTVTIQIFFGHLIYESRKATLNNRETPRLADLKNRMNDMQSTITQRDHEPSPVVLSMIERLADLIERVQHVSPTEATLEKV